MKTTMARTFLDLIKIYDVNLANSPNLSRIVEVQMDDYQYCTRELSNPIPDRAIRFTIRNIGEHMYKFKRPNSKDSHSLWRDDFMIIKNGWKLEEKAKNFFSEELNRVLNHLKYHYGGKVNHKWNKGSF